MSDTSITLTLHLKAQSVTAGPPLGPALAKYKLQIPDIMRKFNDATSCFTKGAPVITKIIVTPNNKGYDYELKIGTPTVTALVKEALGMDLTTGKFDNSPGRQEPSRTITRAQVASIAKIKALDGCDEEANIRTIESTLKSMNIPIVN